MHVKAFAMVPHAIDANGIRVTGKLIVEVIVYNASNFSRSGKRAGLKSLPVAARVRASLGERSPVELYHARRKAFPALR
jgi:hypothetical protein